MGSSTPAHKTSDQFSRSTKLLLPRLEFVNVPVRPQILTFQEFTLRARYPIHKLSSQISYRSDQPSSVKRCKCVGHLGGKQHSRSSVGGFLSISLDLINMSDSTTPGCTL